MMKTIEIYEKTDTKELQMLLNQYETYLENGNILLEMFENKDDTFVYKNHKVKLPTLKTTMIDYEIDVHLIRMELNKRLWKGDLK